MKKFLDLSIMEFCEGMMEGLFSESEIYAYADSVSEKEMMEEVTYASIVTDRAVKDYITMLEKHYASKCKSKTSPSQEIDKERIYRLFGRGYQYYADQFVSNLEKELIREGHDAKSLAMLAAVCHEKKERLTPGASRWTYFIKEVFASLGLSAPTYREAVLMREYRQMKK